MPRRRSVAWTLGLTAVAAGLVAFALVPAVRRVRDAASSSADL
jgi:hypothetical protein